MDFLIKTKRLMVLFLLTLATAACAADPIHLTEADNGRTNSVSVGGVLEIVLKGNPTTGYSWDVSSFNTNVLQQVGGVEYRQSEEFAGKQMVGVGGRFTFRFKAVKFGQGRIKLIYRRPWETTASDQTYSAVFDVK